MRIVSDQKTQTTEKKTDHSEEKKEAQTFDHLIHVFNDVSEPESVNNRPVQKQHSENKPVQKRTGTAYLTEDGRKDSQKSSDSTKKTDRKAEAYVKKADPKDDASHTATWVLLGTVSLVTKGGAVYLKHRRHAA